MRKYSHSNALFLNLTLKRFIVIYSKANRNTLTQWSLSRISRLKFRNVIGLNRTEREIYRV